MRKNKVLFIFLGLYLYVYLFLIQIGGAFLLPLIANYSVSKYVPYINSLERIKVKLLPYPVIDVSKISSTSPSFKIRASKIRIVPDISHLIIGSPFLNISLGSCDVEFFYQNKAKRVSPTIVLPRNKYLMHLFLSKGRARIHFKNHIVKLNDIKANLSNKLGLWGEISASSPKAQKIFFNFYLKQNRFSFSSHIHNALIINYIAMYFPKISRWIEGKLKVDMCLKGKFYNNKLFIRSVIASPSIYLIKGCKMKNPYIDISIQTNLSSSHNIDVYIKKIRILHPNIVIGGEIKYTSSKIKVNLYAPTIDYGAWLKEYQKLGIKIHIMDSLSKIVRGGRISNLSFYLSRSLHHPMCWGLMGRGEDMDVLIPSVGLKLSHVEGGFSVKNKILYCSNASGIVKGSKFYNANLVLGLNPKIFPFDLRVNAQFRLENLNFLLRQVHTSENVQKKLEKLDIKRGRCRGWVHVWKDNSSFYVEVRARNVSLQGEIKESRVPFDLKCGFFHLSTKNSYVAIKDIKGNIGISKITSGTLSVDMYKKQLSIEMASEYMSISQLSHIISYIFNVPSISRYIDNGSLDSSIINLVFSYRDKRIIGARISGIIDKIELKRYLFSNLLNTSDIPFRYMHLSKGKFLFSPNSLSLMDLDIRVRDSYIHLKKADFFKGEKGIAVTLMGKGRVGRALQFIIRQEAPCLRRLKLKSLLNINAFRVRFLPGESVFLNVSLRLDSSSIMDLHIYNMIRSHIIKGEMSVKTAGREELSVRCIKRKKEFFLGFKGILTHRVLDSILLENPWIKDKIKGNFSLRIGTSPLSLSHFKGRLSLYNIACNISGLSVMVRRAHLNGKGRRIELKEGDLWLNGDFLHLKGQLYLLKQDSILDLMVDGKKLDLDYLISCLTKHKEKGKSWKIGGRIRVSIGHLVFLQRDIKDFKALIKVKSDQHALVLINRALLGGLSLKGEANISSKDVKFFLSVYGKSVPVDKVLKGIFKEDSKIITGDAVVKIRIKGRFPFAKEKSSVFHSLSGSVDLFVKGGRIYKLTLLSRILAILNSTEIFFGNIPSLDKEGFGYKHLCSKGKIEKGVLTIERSVIDGDTMDIIFHGKIYLATKTLKMIAFIAPLKTVDRLVKKIPLVNSILKGHLLLIPVSITGKLNDPTVIPLSPTALSSEIFQILKNIIKLPFTIFKPAQ